jgi:hypothetical protein
MNDIEKIIEKIKKLLALAKSPNPNEAAIALKMAQDLIAEYKIDQSDVNIMEIESKDAKTAYRDKPPRYELLLFSEISSAFGCKLLLFCYGYKKCCWRFIGLSHRAKISAYIGQVLLRKLRAARVKYYKSLFRVRSSYRKIQRADDFCLAWVNTVTDKLSTFAGISEEEQKAIELYQNKNYPDLQKLTSTKRSFGNAEDYYNGCKAGAGVELQYGVGVDPRSSLLLGD